MESSRLGSGAFTRNGHQSLSDPSACFGLSCEDVSGTECPMAQVAVSPGILLQPGSAFSRKMAQKSSTGDFPGSLWLSLSGISRGGVNLPFYGHFWQCGKGGAAVTTGTPALGMTLHSSTLWDVPAAVPTSAWQPQGPGALTPAPCAALCCLERRLCASIMLNCSNFNQLVGCTETQFTHDVRGAMWQIPGRGQHANGSAQVGKGQQDPGGRCRSPAGSQCGDICLAIPFQHAAGWHPSSSEEGIGSSSSQQLLSTAQ